MRSRFLQRSGAVPGLRGQEPVKRVAIVGSGLIGAGWATQFLLAGYRVVAWDAADRWQDRLLQSVRDAFERLGIATRHKAALVDRIEIADSCESAASSADFVQESGPEEIGTKQALLTVLSAAARKDVVIASSTSGLPMSELQQSCVAPERMAIGHPFHPVYLMPLVEVVGGRATSSEVVEWLATFYRSLGKEAIVCTKETIGFIANRLQEAMFREALHMINAGEASVDQIDRAVRFGPGLRWAFMGPFLTYHAAGGRGGIRGFFRNFAATLEQPYSRLRAPELTEELVAAVIDGCEAAYGGGAMEAVDKWRDGNLQSLLRVIQPRQ